MSKALNYRPDIDSLRAVAVLSVVIFHFKHAWLPGGFLGVDIFFVISGFLITLIIHREMSAAEFSFKAFYIRRIKRILPAFFVVLFATLLAALFIFPPNDYKFLGRSLFASLFFSANLYSALGQGYFDPAQEEKPLLHIWSLSVEEQYYFLFPLVCLWLVKRSWRTQILCLCGLILLSSMLSFLPSFGLDKYYLPHLRAGEMFIGSLTAVFMQYCHQKNDFPAARFAAPASIAATLVLFICLFTYHSKMPQFPGFAALIPCFATSALIYFNNFEHRFKKLFELKWIVAIGLISYSLYLWHWPILAFARYWIGSSEIPISWMPLLAVAMFTFAIASYLWVERPTRKLTMPFAKNLIYIYVIPTFFISACWYLFQYLPLLDDYRKQGLARDYSSCHNNFSKRCVWGEESVKPKVLMLGDSHADHYKTFIDTIGKREKWSATLVSSDTCAYVENYQARIFKFGKNCRAMHQFAQNNLHEYPIVILAMRWGNQIDAASQGHDPQFFAKLDDTLAKLSKQKEAVYLFTDTPNIDRAGLRAYKLAQVFNLSPVSFKATDISAKNTTESNQKMKDIAAKYPNVYVIDTTALIPSDFVENGKPLFADLDHISPYGGVIMAEKFLQKHSLLADK